MQKLKVFYTLYNKLHFNILLNCHYHNDYSITLVCIECLLLLVLLITICFPMSKNWSHFFYFFIIPFAIYMYTLYNGLYSCRTVENLFIHGTARIILHWGTREQSTIYINHSQSQQKLLKNKKNPHLSCSSSVRKEFFDNW